MKAERNRSRPMSAAELEQKLQADALLRFQTPPARLQGRIVATAQESQQDAVRVVLMHWRRGRTMVLASVMLVVVCCGAMLAIRESERRETVMVDAAPSKVSAMVAQAPRAVDRAMAAPARLDVSAPLRSEARLIARDVERTYHVIRASLPHNPGRRADGDTR